MDDSYIVQVREMAQMVYSAGQNIDFFPTNFVVANGAIFYIYYECNPSLIVRLQTPQRVDKEKICNYSRKTQLTKVADSNLSAGSAMPSTLWRDKTQIWITENALENMQ